MSPLRLCDLNTLVRYLAGTACILLLVLVPCVSASTTEVQVIKMARDGTTILNTTNVTAQWMETHLPVLGDGATHYYHQGPVFEDSTDPAWCEELRWNREESKSVQAADMGAVKGTNLRDLCNLAGGMQEGDTVTLISADGMTREFLYQNVYHYSSRQGPMVLTWYRAGEGFVPSYGEGMKLIFFADNSTNPFGLHVFGNTDWRESAPRSSWNYLVKGMEKYPDTSGLALASVTTIRINSALDPPGSIKVLSEPPGASIILDGRTTRFVTPATVGVVDPGIHTILVTRAGFISPQPRSVQVLSHDTTEISFALVPETPAPTPAGTPSGENAAATAAGTGTVKQGSTTLQQTTVPTPASNSGSSLLGSLLSGVRNGLETIVSAVVTSFEAGQVVRSDDAQPNISRTTGTHVTTPAGQKPLNRTGPATPVVTQTQEKRAQNTTILVSSDPPGALIILDGVETGRLTPNTLEVSGTSTHMIGLVMENFIPFTEQVSGPGTKEINASLVPFEVNEQIPDDGDESDGTMDSTTLAMGDGGAGRNAPPDTNQKAATVTPSHHGSIYITSYPAGCTISVNNQVLKALTPTLVCAVKEGPNVIKVEMKGKEGDKSASLTRSIWVYPDALTTAHFPVGMPDAFDRITITSADYQGATFTIDGRYPQKRIPSQVEARDPSSYITLQREDGYYSFQVPVQLTDGESFELKDPKRPLHTLQVESNPPGAEVFIDGFRTGYVTPYKVSGLSEGPHRIMLSCSGYIPQDRLINVPISEETMIRNPEVFILERFPAGDLFVDSREAGASIQMNGFPTGEVTPYTFKGLIAGTYEVYLSGKDFTGKRKTATTQRSVETDRLVKCIINLNLI